MDIHDRNTDQTEVVAFRSLTEQKMSGQGLPDLIVDGQGLGAY